MRELASAFSRYGLRMWGAVAILDNLHCWTGGGVYVQTSSLRLGFFQDTLQLIHRELQALSQDF